MRLKRKILSRPIFLLLSLLALERLQAQEEQPQNILEKLQQLPGKFFKQTEKKYDRLAEKLDKQNQKILARFQQSEKKLYKKLAKTDSTKAKQLIAQSQEQYNQLKEKLNNPSQHIRPPLQEYLPRTDSLQTLLNFTQQYQEQLPNLNLPQLQQTREKIKAVQEQIRASTDIKKFLRERKEQLKNSLQNTAIANQLKQINKQAFYYQQQIQEYKNLLNDPQKLEQKALQLLSQTSAFKNFMANNSQLASLFRLPGSNAAMNADPSQALAGLQTRAQVNQLISQQLGMGTNNNNFNPQGFLQDQVAQAQSQLDQLKNKLNNQIGGNTSSDIEMPQGFKPNNQKTKSFLQRIELGFNIQSQRSNGWLPSTSDIALTAGYKLNDKSITGIGLSYKLGLGKNLRNIQLTHEGISLRTFVDVKLPSLGGVGGGFWLTGGYEQNFQQRFQEFDVLKDRSLWQQSGLMGITKKYQITKKKKGQLQLLWDFLSYQQVPRRQPILFRTGLNF